MSATRTVSLRARELRESFDATFSRPPPPPPSLRAALLLFRAGGELVAIRRSQMTGLARAENIAPAPGRSPAFVGLAGLRGVLYPVWRLAGLLDRSAASAADGAGGSSWLVLAAARPEAPCAFACEGFERLVFMVEKDLPPPGAHRPMVAWNTTLVPLIDLAALQAEIHGRRESSTPVIPP